MSMNSESQVMGVKARLWKAMLGALIFISYFLFLFPAPASAATLSDGVWSQSGAPGTSTISYIANTAITAGDKIVLTFPAEATLNAVGNNITMSGQTAPARTNDAINGVISITTDGSLAPGAPVTISMTDALSAYDPTLFAQQSVSIIHTSSSDVGIDTGLAIITNDNTTIVTAVVPGSLADTDGDGIPDYLEAGDRDGDGIPDYLDYDPSGYIYDEANGEIVSGGLLSVSGPGVISMIQDGSGGFYQWFTDGTPGVYTAVVTPPAGYALSELCEATPGPFDPTGGPVSGVFLGNDRVGTTDFLPNNDCTTYYFTFDLVGGDPFIYHNNYPLRKLASGPLDNLSPTGRAVIGSVVVGIVSIGISFVLIRRTRAVDKAKGRGG